MEPAIYPTDHDGSLLNRLAKMPQNTPRNCQYTDQGPFSITF